LLIVAKTSIQRAIKPQALWKEIVKDFVTFTNYKEIQVCDWLACDSIFSVGRKKKARKRKQNSRVTLLS
jgi:hypothetical protein